MLNQCFDEAERRTPAMLKRCIDAVMNSLQLAEGASLHNAQRQLFARATWSIAQCRGALAETFPVRLREAFEQQVDDPSASTLAGLFDSSLMQLVDDSAMNESLESVRLLQNLLPLVEHSLPILDARMSSLIGLDSIEVEKNPMRPSVFARVLRDLMAEVEEEGGIRVVWLQHIAHVLGRELGQLYEALALMLQQANVQEAGYRIRLVEDPEASRAASAPDVVTLDMLSMGDADGGGRDGGGDDSADLEPAALGRSRSELGNAVFQDFLAGGSGGGVQPLDEGYYEQVRRELGEVDALSAMPVASEALSGEALSRYRATPVVDRPGRQVSVDTTLAADRWGHYGLAHERTRVLLELKARAEDAAQAIGLDLVRKLVNQVARDPLLLAPVREAVVALEPALLRLALANPRYFGESDHPARLLVEEVAQRSFRYNDEFADDFLAYLEPVCAAFNALNALESEKPRPFADALGGLRKRWQQADAVETAAREAQLSSVRFAEARQQLADQMAWEISLRPDVFNAPELVLDFFYGTWSLVMATAQLRPVEGAPDIQACRSAVGTLLWSVRPETMRQSKAVFESLPGLLQCLHSGLDALGMSKSERQPFFDALMRLHQPLLSLRRVRVKGDQALPGTDGELDEPVKRDLSVAPRVFVTAQPWMATGEWADAGFQDTELDPQDEADPLPPVEQADQVAEPSVELHLNDPVPFVEAQEAVAPAVVEDQPADRAVLARLRAGCLVDMYSQGAWIRAELIWASARGTLFMFSSAGGRAHSMTRRSCEKLIGNHWLRLVETHAVVENAVQALTATAPTKGKRKRRRLATPA
ncbi:hypothetical protein LPB72_18925 [Hydrogenophaga crassostreae]|uniref:DUF1631 domain-containing protein n=1 Tax=Hydrogenophaga crassostreae TaxID=1763535 RepID=A0A167H3R3_9BURK|nr:hypothetical protein LPB072_09430 [Hydrogenophaga crassostreae]OAD40219.1 hypothetical protein LPB72_18925 [Hydrogenophaga crassostreae]